MSHLCLILVLVSVKCKSSFSLITENLGIGHNCFLMAIFLRMYYLACPFANKSFTCSNYQVLSLLLLEVIPRHIYAPSTFKRQLMFSFNRILSLQLGDVVGENCLQSFLATSFYPLFLRLIPCFAGPQINKVLSTL